MLIRKHLPTMHSKILAGVLAEFPNIQSTDPKQPHYVAPYVVLENHDFDVGAEHYLNWQNLNDQETVTVSNTTRAS